MYLERPFGCTSFVFTTSSVCCLYAEGGSDLLVTDVLNVEARDQHTFKDRPVQETAQSTKASTHLCP
jgi:hypothetical protein